MKAWRYTANYSLAQPLQLLTVQHTVCSLHTVQNVYMNNRLLIRTDRYVGMCIIHCFTLVLIETVEHINDLEKSVYIS